MDKATQEWIKIAEYDLETAKAMLKTKRYLYVVFMCQQAIEKILKAIYSKQKKELPPRIHNLINLSNFLELEISEEDKNFLSKLNQFYIATRYPSEHIRLAKSLDQDKAKNYLNKTEEMLECLRKKIL